MSLRRHIMRGLRVLIKRRASDQDLADEAEHYLEQATEEYIARGFSPEEAGRGRSSGVRPCVEHPRRSTRTRLGKRD